MPQLGASIVVAGMVVAGPLLGSDAHLSTVIWASVAGLTGVLVAAWLLPTLLVRQGQDD